MRELGTILGVWAHPDDETYLSAGIMARAVQSGSRVMCITATRGEGGSMDEDRWPSATLGQVRSHKLLRSLAILGVTEHEFLDLPDIGMDDPLPESGAARVVEIMAEVGPDTVLTFGPDGMTGHRAHQSVSRWATEAFAATGRPGARLLYATCTPEWAAHWVPRLEPLDLYRPGTPPVTPRAELALDVQLPPELLDLKLAAFEAHESQMEGLISLFGRDGLGDAFGEEVFRLGAGGAA
jgi:LmbE family N-acetylglucosaminyl deacetylase